MSHLDEGTRRDDVARALAALDEPFDVEAARAEVRARVAGAAAERAGGPSLLRTRSAAKAMRRAAGILLLAAAGASAIPGSPLRDWVGALITSETAHVEPGAEAEAVVEDGAEAAGVRIRVTAPVRVTLVGVREGEEVTVSLVAGDEVAVFAEAGSRFSSGASLVQATVSGGPVRVELPTEVHPLTLAVNGRVYLRNGAGGLDTLVEPAARDSRELRFVVQGGGSS